MIIGSIMLFDTAGPFIRLSLATILPAVFITVLFFTIAVRLTYKAWKRRPITGKEGLVGLEGVAMSDISDKGMAMVHGEYWKAFSDDTIEKGDAVIVESVEGLRVKVTKKTH
jgi:membrane-bound serine protease (ClpP class)